VVEGMMIVVIDNIKGMIGEIPSTIWNDQGLEFEIK